MIKFSELQPGDIVMAEYEGQKWRGVVTGLNREDKEVGVDTGVQEFWFTPEHLYPVALSDEQLQLLGFTKEQESDGGVKYKKDSFRIHLPVDNDFSHMDIWWREDRRTLKHPISVHELQNHYYDMTKVELNPA